MFYEEYPIPAEADFENLPPLVAEGDNRQEKLTQVIDRWEAFTPEVWREYAQNKNHQHALEEHPASLFKIDLRDDNPEAEPIDLNGDLLKPLAERLAAKAKGDASNTKSSYTNKTLAIVPLLCCKIHRCGLSELNLHAEFIAVSCLFENGLHIWGSTFCSELNLRKSIFRKMVHLIGCRFMSAIDLDSAKATELLFFNGCIFEQRVNLIRFKQPHIFICHSSIFKGSINFHKSNLSRLRIEGCLIAGHIGFDDSIFHDTHPSFHRTDLRCAS